MQNSDNTFLQAFLNSGLLNENTSVQLLPISSSQTTSESVANVEMLPATTSGHGTFPSTDVNTEMQQQQHHLYTDLDDPSTPKENSYPFTEFEGMSKLQTGDRDLYGENQGDPLLTLLENWNLEKVYQHFKCIIKLVKLR